MVLAALMIPAAMAEAQTLPNGGYVDGVISFPGEIDTYSLVASAGERLLFRVADTTNSESFVPVIRVISPGGASKDSSTLQLVNSLELTAGTSGTYTVSVLDSVPAPSGTGTYRLHTARIPGANEGGLLGNSAEVSGTVNLGDLDTYTIFANAGNRLQVRIADINNVPGFLPAVRVFNPNGSYCCSTTGGEVATSIHVDAFSTGTYTLLVEDSTDFGRIPTGSGQYNLYFAQAGANEGGRIYDGDLVTGQIDLGDIDSFTFTATAGQQATLQLTRTSANPNFRPRMDVLFPNGTIWTSQWSGASVTLSGVLSPSGTYTVLVSDYEDSFPIGTGSYSLSLSGVGGIKPVSEANGDAPIPPWALVMLGCGLMVILSRDRRAQLTGRGRDN
jgi:hypothetical protein